MGGANIVHYAHGCGSEVTTSAHLVVSKYESKTQSEREISCVCRFPCPMLHRPCYHGVLDCVHERVEESVVF